MNDRLEIVNLQKNFKLDLTVYREFIRKAAKTVPESANKHFAVAFIDDDRMWKTNWSFRGKDSTTDVLSFPYHAEEFEINNNNLGDIAISVDQARKQAAENGLELEVELKQLILHGLLHLCGYDHETDNGEMNARELELRDKLGI